MTKDFFARLASRSLGQTPLVRPRLAPRFAQAPELPSEPPEWSGEKLGEPAAREAETLAKQSETAEVEREGSE